MTDSAYAYLATGLALAVIFTCIAIMKARADAPVFVSGSEVALRCR